MLSWRLCHVGKFARRRNERKATRKAAICHSLGFCSTAKCLRSHPRSLIRLFLDRMCSTGNRLPSDIFRGVVHCPCPCQHFDAIMSAGDGTIRVDHRRRSLIPDSRRPEWTAVQEMMNDLSLLLLLSRRSRVVSYTQNQSDSTTSLNIHLLFCRPVGVHDLSEDPPPVLSRKLWTFMQ